MNIFATSSDPVASARSLDLKRVVKMILESFQLMSSAMWNNEGKGFYNLTHSGHPCTKWVSHSTGNFQWLLEHAKALLAVYSEAYGKVHACSKFIPDCEAYLARQGITAMTPHPNCTEFKVVSDVHLAYRMQMLKKWSEDERKPKWLNNQSPQLEWVDELEKASQQARLHDEPGVPGGDAFSRS